jgi:hypothetical protein
MGLEPPTLCLGRLGPIIRSSALSLNLATHHSPIEADGHQIANRRYYTPIAGQFNAILWPSDDADGNRKKAKARACHSVERACLAATKDRAGHNQEVRAANLADDRLGDEFGGLAQLVDLKVRRP